MVTSDSSNESGHEALKDTREFHHTPLNQNKQQIRLVKFVTHTTVETPDQPTTIAFEIENFDLAAVGPDNAIQYTALSYEWGPQSPRCRILVNGCGFYIRSNLHDFFSELRCRVGAYLWVDQLCIDQNLVTERNHQVQIMSDIFSNADEVYAWLGNASDDSKGAMEYLQKFEDCYDFLTERDSSCVRPTMSELSDEGKRAIRDLLSRCYWSRLWIVQEVTLARRLSFMCGSSFLKIRLGKSSPRYFHLHMDIHQFPLDLHLDDRFVRLLESHEPGLDLLRYITEIRHREDRFMGRIDAQVLDTLRLSYERKCDDARDHIYGVQTLYPDPWRISVDYNLTAEEVYTNFLKHTKPLWQSKLLRPKRFLYVQLRKTMGLKPSFVLRAKYWVLDNVESASDIIWLPSKLFVEMKQRFT